MARAVALSANPLLRIKLPALRSQFVMLLLALSFLALVLRAAWLQTMSTEFLQRQGEARYERSIELPASRGKIIDRNGVVLASSLPARTVWAIPSQVDAPRETIAQLARMLDLPERDLRARLDQDERSFVFLKRQVEPDLAAKVDALGIRGIHLGHDYKRYYPEGSSLAHVVGFTNVEDNGLEGMEKALQGQLAGQVGHRRVVRDRLGRIVEDVRAVREPRDGRDATLSLDSKIQFVAFGALRDAVREHRAKAGAAVVLDARSGEVLALANWPTYDPNLREQHGGPQLRNRVLTDAFEPGSTMKPFTVALALEMGRVSPRTLIDTGNGRLQIGPSTIGDSHKLGTLTVEEVVSKSSNVGTAKLALSMPSREMWDMLIGAGFGQAPRIEFPGAVAGRVLPLKTWKPIEQATMSYGHGISVTLMQLARAYTVFARDGDLAPVTILRTDGPVGGTRLIRPETARAVRKMLEMAASPQGTAARAQVRGYRVAGKTGTAYKIENGQYVKKYVASFVGFAPASDPRLVVAVMIDEPGAGKHYGGEVAAPVFSRIIGDSLRAMRVPPDAPSATLVIPANPPAENL